MQINNRFLHGNVQGRMQVGAAVRDQSKPEVNQPTPVPIDHVVDFADPTSGQHVVGTMMSGAGTLARQRDFLRSLPTVGGDEGKTPASSDSGLNWYNPWSEGPIGPESTNPWSGTHVAGTIGSVGSGLENEFAETLKRLTAPVTKESIQRGQEWAEKQGVTISNSWGSSDVVGVKDTDHFVSPALAPNFWTGQS